MRRVLPGLAAVATLALAYLACRPTQEAAERRAMTELAARAGRFDQRARRLAAGPAVADSAPRHEGAPVVARWVLPQALREISGLALTADGRLLTHGDEQGIVTEVDYRRGVVVKQFVLGAKPIADDFEGIAVAGDRIFLVTSTGALYEVREGRDRERVRHLVHDTGAGAVCEVEGLAYDPSINSLLLACKNLHQKARRGVLLVLRWRLDQSPGPRLSELAVPLGEIKRRGGWKGDEFHASGIERDPRTGNYVLISAQESGLVEITPEGGLVGVRPLPEHGHQQPEGVAITPDGVLVVSDEENRRPATVTAYPAGAFLGAR